MKSKRKAKPDALVPTEEVASPAPTVESTESVGPPMGLAEPPATAKVKLW